MQPLEVPLTEQDVFPGLIGVAETILPEVFSKPSPVHEYKSEPVAERVTVLPRHIEEEEVEIWTLGDGFTVMLTIP